MKRIAPVFLALALTYTLFLSGCASVTTVTTYSSETASSSGEQGASVANTDSGSSTGSNTSKGASSKSGAQSTPAQGNKGGTTVTLTVWTQANAQYTFFTWVKTQIESKYPNIKLRITAQPSSQLGVPLDAILDGANAPDITATWGGLVVPTLIKGKRILPLGDVVTPSVEASFNDAAKYNKNDSSDGVYYMAPLHGFVSPVIFFNKTEFQKLLSSAAVSDAQKAAIQAAINGTGPNTLDEFELIAKGIRAAGKQPLIGGFNTAPLSHFMQAIDARTMTADQFSATLVKSKTVNPFDNDGFQKGFDLLKEYNTRGILADRITGYSDTSAKDSFYSEKALMLAGISLDLKDHQRGLPTDDIGAFLLPRDSSNTSGPRASGVYCDGFVINSKCKNPNEAKTVLSYILSKEAQSKLYEYDFLPVRKDADSSKASAILKPIINSVNNEGITGFYQNYSYSGIDADMVNLCGAIINGTKASAQARTQIADTYRARIMGN